MTGKPDPALVDRFAADLDALVGSGQRIGVAVSGGPDSLALLLLAAAARPGAVEAATVDHRLRPESRAEAEMVASICARLGVRHRILAREDEPPRSNVQAWARELRYALLGDWATQRGLAAVATAHHADDQAETLLLRLARGSGIGGLAGVQRSRRLVERVMLVRPLLDWRRAELRIVVDSAGLEAVDDPSNTDERFDRSRARALLASADWLDAERLAAAASNASDAEEALEWAAMKAFDERHSRDGAVLSMDCTGLPRELKRRLLLRAVELLSGETPSGPKLMAAIDALEAGATTTLAGLKLEGGATWRLSPAPPRRTC